MEPPGFIRLTNDYGDPNAESRETLQAAGNLNLSHPWRCTGNRGIRQADFG